MTRGECLQISHCLKHTHMRRFFKNNYILQDIIKIIAPEGAKPQLMSPLRPDLMRRMVKWDNLLCL